MSEDSESDRDDYQRDVDLMELALKQEPTAATIAFDGSELSVESETSLALSPRSNTTRGGAQPSFYKTNGQFLEDELDEDGDLDDDDDTVLSYLAENTLPASVETCLAINQAYQELISQYVSRIQVLISQNRERQEVIQSVIDSNSVSSQRFLSKVPLQIFVPPYFKDSSGMGPPRNEEALLKLQNNEYNALVQRPRPWMKSEKDKLILGIKECILERELKPLMNRKELYIEKIKNAGVSEQDMCSQLKEKLHTIDVEIGKIRRRSNDLLLCGVDYEKIDWMKIANADLSSARTAFECQLIWVNELRPGLNTAKWTKEEEARLRSLVAQHDEMADWDTIAVKLGRPAWDCFRKYQCEMNVTLRKVKNEKWSPEEDQALREVVETCRVGNHIPWDQVSYYMDGRSRAQCQAHWSRSLDPNTKKGRWTEEEDLLLIAAVQKYGAKEWWKVAELVPGRKDTQCRERWTNSLDASIKLGAWNEEEDEKLMVGINMFGAGNWSTISKLVSGRTPSSCVQRYKTLCKMREVTLPSPSSTHGGRFITGLKFNVRTGRLCGAALPYKIREQRNRLRLERAKQRKASVMSLFQSLGGSLTNEVEQHVPAKVEQFVTELPETLREIVKEAISAIDQKFKPGAGNASDDDGNAENVSQEDIYVREEAKRMLREPSSSGTADPAVADRLTRNVNRQILVRLRKLIPALTRKSHRTTGRDALREVLRRSFTARNIQSMPPTSANVSAFRSLLLHRKALSAVSGWVAQLSQTGAIRFRSGGDTLFHVENTDEQQQRQLETAVSSVRPVRAAARKASERIVLKHNHQQSDHSMHQKSVPACSSSSIHNEVASSVDDIPIPEWLNQLTQTESFKTLESQFRGLFLWPALLCAPETINSEKATTAANSVMISSDVTDLNSL